MSVLSMDGVEQGHLFNFFKGRAADSRSGLVCLVKKIKDQYVTE